MPAPMAYKVVSSPYDLGSTKFSPQDASEYDMNSSKSFYNAASEMTLWPMQMQDVIFA